MLLTKSKYVQGLKCIRYFWMLFNQKHLIPAHSASTQLRFDEGHEVGSYAKQLFPDGIDIQEENFTANIESTKEAIKNRKTIFEAGIATNGFYARADVLIPVNEDEWDVVEVKSAGRVKDDHVQDLAFQKYVYNKAGLKIRNLAVTHINSKYVRQGDINVNEYLVTEDVTELVADASKNVEQNVKKLLAIMELPRMPPVDYPEHSYGSNQCAIAGCFNELPEHNVMHLYRDSKKGMAFLLENIKALKDIPEDSTLNHKQRIQRKAAIENKVQVDKKGLQNFLKTLKEPIANMDFETIKSAIPIFDGTRPFQQIPFQFCVFTNNKAINFIYDDNDDPRPAFLKALKEALPKEGSIVVFNKDFEIGRLKELKAMMPEESAFIDDVIERIVDLIIPFRAFDYYNLEQKGKCGLKSVLPSVTGKDYDELDINNGDDASNIYFQTKKPLQPKLKQDLIKYCQLDTEGMQWIVNELKRLST